MLARDLMRSPDADIHVDHNLEEARARFQHFGRDRLLVIDADEVVGTLHRDDLPEEPPAGSSVTVQEVMRAEPAKSCPATAPADAVRALLQTHPYVLVVDGERQVVGIVEGADLARKQAEPAASDGTGGRAIAAPDGRLKTYAERPRLRRLREAGA